MKKEIIFKRSVYKFAEELAAILESFDQDAWTPCSEENATDSGITNSLSTNISVKSFSLDYFYDTLNELGNYTVCLDSMADEALEFNLDDYENLITFSEFFKIVKRKLFQTFPVHNFTNDSHDHTIELHIPYDEIKSDKWLYTKNISITVKPSETMPEADKPGNEFYLYMMSFQFTQLEDPDNELSKYPLMFPESNLWKLSIISISLYFNGDYDVKIPERTLKRLKATLKNHAVSEKWTELVSDKPDNLFWASNGEFSNFKTFYSMRFVHEKWKKLKSNKKEYYYAPYIWWKLYNLRVLDDINNTNIKV